MAMPIIAFNLPRILSYPSALRAMTMTVIPAIKSRPMLTVMVLR
jgi:hypothetical protein